MTVIVNQETQIGRSTTLYRTILSAGFVGRVLVFCEIVGCLSTKMQNITEIAFPGAPASRERWCIFTIISEKTANNADARVPNLMFTFCSHCVRFLFAFCSL